MAERAVGDRPAGRRPSKVYIAGKALREFFADECWDRAAGMTFFGVLSLPPIAVALASLLALVGQGDGATESVLQVLGRLAPDEDALEALSRPVTEVLEHPSAGVAFVVGLATALWLAAGYVGSLGRALNHIHGVREGRPMWRLQLWHLLTTVVLVVFAVVVALLLVVSGPVAEAVGTALGFGRRGVAVWEALRLPVLAAGGVMIVAVLYYAAPNVRHPRFRFFTAGSLLALAVSGVATYAFRLYVATGRFDLTYGRVLAGIVVLSVWLWIVNMALLLGAELDTEIHRARQLVAGIPAYVDAHHELRDTRATEKAEVRRASDEARARSLYASHGWAEDPEEPDDDPDVPGGGAGPLSRRGRPPRTTPRRRSAPPRPGR